MATISERLEEATQKAEQASNVAQQWANADDTTVITTEGNPLDSIQKFQKEKGEAIEADINSRFDAMQAGDFTNRAETAAEVAMAAGWVYTDVSSGEAARVDGDYFWVVANSEWDALELWLMGSTTASDTGKRIPSVNSNKVAPSGLEWNPNDDTYDRVGTTGVTEVHRRMRRCLLLDDGTVNYYLDPNDSTKKIDGTPADLSGADGQVMVETPLTYVRYTEVVGGVKPIQKYEVSAAPLAGFVPHPAFCIGGTLEKKNGFWQVTNPTKLRNYVYRGAYKASMYDASADSYVSGLNLDDMTANIDFANDKLASVSGVYPLVGVTRPECRTLAANRGTGWCQTPFWVQALHQLLFAVEYGDFKSQQVLANGNVSVSTGYPASSVDQLDSPHSVAGKSDLIGDSSGGVDSTIRDTAWMSYRGIENLWGNCYEWVDGVNILDGNPFVSNDPLVFADNTSTNYTDLGVITPTTNGYISDVHADTLAFIPKESAGTSSSNFADYFYYGTGWRVLSVGGYATIGGNAGAFIWSGISSSSYASRTLGARLCYLPE